MNLVSVTSPARGQRWRAVRFAAIAGVGALVAMTFSPQPAGAWETWSAEEYPSWLGNPPVGNCQTCHGQFRATNEDNSRPYLSYEYISLTDGEPWDVIYQRVDQDPPPGEYIGLHEVHRRVILDPTGLDPTNLDPNGNPRPVSACNVCHTEDDHYPVYLSDSAGSYSLTSGLSCVGCHGRQEDEGAPITDETGEVVNYAGYGAGLRQHHTNAGVNVCRTCHQDADPAWYTPVGENVLPPYYVVSNVLPDSYPGGFVNKPTNPCNPHGEEDYAATKLGLDNDGDGLYDKQDPDCRPIGPGNNNGKGGK